MEIKILVQRFYDHSVHIRGFTPATIRRYKYVLQFYCRYRIINFIEDVTAKNIRELFYYGRIERKWSTNTFIVFYKSLKVFFDWCVREGYINANPVLKIEKPKLEQKLPVKLTKQDAMHLLEVVNNYPYNNEFLRHRNYAMFALFIFGGLRLNELLSLKLNDIDLPNMTIFISQGKGSKDRIVPINPSLKNILKRYVEERKKMNKTCPSFFVSFTRNISFTKSGMKNLVAKIVAASGLKFSVHKLRHTFATLMLEGGCDIFSLSRMMGHSDIKTTTIYLYASAEHLRSQIILHPLSQ